MQFLKEVISIVRKREKERKYKCGINMCVCVCGGGAQIVEIDSDKLRSQGTKLWKHILKIKDNA